MENSKINWKEKMIFIIVVVVLILVYIVVPDVLRLVNKVLKMFASGDFTVVREFVESYGAYAAAVSYLPLEHWRYC